MRNPSSCGIVAFATVVLIVSAAIAARAQQPHAGPDSIYPDSTQTPGAPNPDITQDNVKNNICNKNWAGINKFTHKHARGTAVVRPPESVTRPIKTATMKAYGFSDSPTHYELDHLISLEDGGCADCVTNLWPEAYGDVHHHMTQTQRDAWDKAHPTSSQVLAGSLQKDKVESYVHDEICFGIPNAKFTSGRARPAKVSITLRRAQEILANDWYMCYVKMLHQMSCE